MGQERQREAVLGEGEKGPRHSAMADVTSRKNEGCVSALININKSAAAGEAFG